MYVHVARDESGSVELSLRDADDCQRFHLAATALTLDDVGAALLGKGAGVVDGEHAYIETAALRQMSTGLVSPGWDERFAAMLEYASSKGWIDDRGRVQAHFELG